MIRKLKLSAILTCALMPLTSVFGQSPLLPALTHHVRPAVRTGEAKPVGQLPLEKVMTLNVVLPLSDKAGLDAFVESVQQPGNPNYRHYLTPAEFTERFGPTQESYDAVVSYLKANGFAIAGGSRDGMDVLVKGTVATIQNAFHVTLGTYQHPTENRVFYAPDREPTTSLPFQLWHISGLDNYSIPHPLLVKKSDFAKAHGIEPDAVVTHATTGSGPSASFLGSDMRAAYYGGTSLTGAGQNLGLFEYLGTDLADLTTYYKNVGQPNNVPITLLSTDGTSTSCVYSRGCDDTEQTLDMTQALGMAPGLSSLVMYIGSIDTAIISSLTTHNPLPTTIGCSWGWTPADPSTLDPYFLKMASQGQTFFAASGDSSTWSSSNEAWPADDANIVSVGGTDLTTASAAGPWSSETAWVDSGGGISPDSIAIPSWQKPAINSSNKGSTTLRNGPDVSANANFTFYTCADQTTCLANEYGGTSFAAPMWAGYIALANQQLAASGDKVGFINPTIYSQNATSAYATDFHDVTSGTSGSYSAVKGYDLVTGWGSPNGSGLISALDTASTTPSFSISASPSAITVTEGTTTVTTTTSISTAISGGFSSAIALSASGAPKGVTVSFNPSSIPAPGSGTSTMSIAVPSGTAVGTYTITVTGTGGRLTETTTVSLTVAKPITGNFTVSVSPTSGSLRRGQSGYAVVTTAISGTFDSSISFSASGVPSGVTYMFNPASISAPGSGTTDFILVASRNAPTGTYSITITATGGGITHTTVLTLQID
jgi:kumamolisin